MPEKNPNIHEFKSNGSEDRIFWPGKRSNKSGIKARGRSQVL